MTISTIKLYIVSVLFISLQCCSVVVSQTQLPITTSQFTLFDITITTPIILRNDTTTQQQNHSQTNTIFHNTIKSHQGIHYNIKWSKDITIQWEYQGDRVGIDEIRIEEQEQLNSKKITQSLTKPDKLNKTVFGCSLYCTVDLFVSMTFGGTYLAMNNNWFLCFFFVLSFVPIVTELFQLSCPSQTITADVSSSNVVLTNSEYATCPY